MEWVDGNGVKRSTCGACGRLAWLALSICFALQAISCWAQMPALVKDVNPSSSSSNSSPGGFAEVDGITYFAAADLHHGRELWRTDGTAEGTFLLKDIATGLQDSSPRYLTNVGGVLFFAANDGVHGDELWKSDGTPFGTVLAVDIFPGSSSSMPMQLTAVGGTLFFGAVGNDQTGRELWKSDGTGAGTMLVKDIFPGNAYSSPEELVGLNGALYFRANEGGSGGELWRSDGTAAGTYLVKDIHAGANGQQILVLTVVGETLFFQADDGISGIELWKSDGTAEGTVMVKDILPGSGSSSPYSLTAVGSTLFFTAEDGVHGIELWKSDGTEEGTVLVRDITPGSNTSASGLLTEVSGTLFFRARTPSNNVQLWKSDGTEGGTQMIQDIEPGQAASNPTALTSLNGNVVFAARDNTYGIELWKSDGSEAGTIQIKDILSGFDSSTPMELTRVGGSILFAANDGVHGVELWKTDGSKAGTQLLKDLRIESGNSDPFDLTRVGDTVYFRADEPSTGLELWRTNGSAGGTSVVKDIFVGQQDGISSSNETRITAVGSQVYFAANDGATGEELWISDGSASGTKLVQDIFPGGDARPRRLTDIDGVLYFTAFDGTYGGELFRSDGTEEGTQLVKDVRSGSDGSLSRHLTNFNGMLLFGATDGMQSLWRSDGTELGTFALKNRLSINDIEVVGGTAFLSGNLLGDELGWELWKTDGTPEGTVLVKDIWPGTSASGAILLTKVGSTLFFRANGGSGDELWKSDGTASGTVLVKDIDPGPGSDGPQELVNVGGTLFFTADDGIKGRELWKSDGTAAGTVLVKDIAPGSGSSSPRNLTDINGVLFFYADDGLHGGEFWISDGTAAGTRLAADIFPGPVSSDPAEFTLLGSQVLFVATNDLVGRELWSFPAPVGVQPQAPVITSIAGPLGTVVVGVPAMVTAAFTDANQADTHTCDFVWGDGSIDLGKPPTGKSCRAPHAFSGAGEYDVQVTVRDNTGKLDVATTRIMVNALQPVPQAPAITSIAGPDDPLAVDQSATVVVQFIDVNGTDTHTCDFVWGDGTTDLGEGAENFICSRVHAYEEAGEYQVGVIVRDSSGLTASGMAAITVISGEGMAAPAIYPGGVVLSNLLPPVPTISPLSIITVFGTDFSNTTILYPNLDQDGKLETTLGGSCVEVGGERAPIFAITPTQANVQVPALLSGPVDIVVIRDCDTPTETQGSPETVTVAPATPGFFLFPPYSNSGLIAARFNGDAVAVAPVGMFQDQYGVSRPAVPGDIIVLYGTGWGEAETVLGTGELASEASELRGEANPTVTFGGVEMLAEDVFYVGVTPNAAGLFQLAIRVPIGMPAGNHQIVLTVYGKSTPTGPVVLVGSL